MSKVQNRKKYNHNTDLVKYSEDGLRKRCTGCVEEFDKLQTSGYCNGCWSMWFREKRKGKELKEVFQQYLHKWEYLKEKYKNVKKCNTCLLIKPKTEFYPDKKSPHGYQSKCISCVKEYNRTSDKYSKPSNKLKHKEYREKHKIKFQKRKVERYHTEPSFKIISLLRHRLHRVIKNKHKEKNTIELLGCSIEEFKLYIENLFLPEFTWENHGEIWELDHIIGCANFNMEILTEQQKCFHYTNLQPLFKTTEIAKSFDYEDQIGNRNKPKFNI
jgi:hypothetical protein